jgi:outer membrane protein assembly factor BamB
MTIFNYFGEGSSPVVHDDLVILNWDHQGGAFITALDARSGETVWKVDRDEYSTWATPLVIEHNGRTQVIVNGTQRVRSYDLKTGEIIWECGGQVRAAIPCPVSDGQLAFAMTGYIGNALFAIPLDSTGDITDTDKIAWKRKEPGTPYVPSPLLYGELLYFTGSNRGLLSCLEAKTGTPLIDRKRLEGISNIYASPVAADNRIYFTGRDGTTVVVKVGGALEILATNKLDDRFDASAAIVGDEIILRGREHLYCIAAE